MLSDWVSFGRLLTAGLARLPNRSVVRPARRAYSGMSDNNRVPPSPLLFAPGNTARFARRVGTRERYVEEAGGRVGSVVGARGLYGGNITT